MSDAVSNSVTEYLCLFTNPRFEKKIAALNPNDRSGVDAALANLDTARNLLLEVKGRLDAHPFKQMSLDDEAQSA